MQAIDSTTGRPAHREAGTRGAAPAERTGALRQIAVVCDIAFLLAFVAVAVYTALQVHHHLAPGQSAPNDISIFWAAAKIALEGAPAAAFDLETLTAARNLPDGLHPASYRMVWSYPPQFHALIVPLGAMPFLLAWLVFALVGIVAFRLALARLVRDPRAVAVACSSPAVLLCAYQGQNSLIVGALLAGLLAALRDARPGLAGGLLGALTIKPQLGLVLPLVLVAAGAWRTIGWAVLATGLIVMLTLLWVGLDYWRAFFEALPLGAERMLSGWLPRHLMVGWYAFAAALGSGPGIAMMVQIAAMALIGAGVCWAWRDTGAAFAPKGAALAIAVPLFSPYVYYYDLVLPMIAVALVLAAGHAGRSPRGTALGASIGLAWVLPLAGFLAKKAGLTAAFALFSAPVLTVFLFLVLREIAQARRHVAA